MKNRLSIFFLSLFLVVGTILPVQINADGEYDGQPATTKQLTKQDLLGIHLLTPLQPTNVYVVNESNYEYYAPNEIADHEDNTKWAFKITNNTQPIKIRYENAVSIDNRILDVEITFSGFVVFDGTEIIPHTYISDVMNNNGGENVVVNGIARPALTVRKDSPALGGVLAGNWFHNIKQVEERIAFFEAGSNFSDRVTLPKTFVSMEQLQRGEKVVFLNNDRQDVYTSYSEHAIRKTEIRAINHSDWGTDGKLWAYDSYLENDDAYMRLTEKQNAKKWSQLGEPHDFDISHAYGLGVILENTHTFDFLFDFQEDSNIEESRVASSYQWPSIWEPSFNILPHCASTDVDKTTAKPGDEINFTISYEMEDLSDVSWNNIEWEYNLGFIDTLDNRLEYVSAWLEGSTPGHDITNDVGQLTYNESNNQVRYVFNEGHYRRKEAYDGTIYKLHIKTKVKDNATPGELINVGERIGALACNRVTVNIVENLGYAKVKYIDITDNNTVIQEVTGLVGENNATVNSVYTQRNKDIKYWTDRGYRLVSDEIATTNPKFKTNVTQTFEIKLEHTYTTVNKRTYVSDKCLNNACTAKQPKNGC